MCKFASLCLQAAGSAIVGVPGVGIEARVWVSKQDSGQTMEHNASESARIGDGRERRERGFGDLLVHNAGLVDGRGWRCGVGVLCLCNARDLHYLRDCDKPNRLRQRHPKP